MPDKLTQKQEAFALAYVETGNASEAYRRAYDAEKMQPQTVWNEASLVLGNREVSVRVMELQEAARERTLVTVESITKELEDVRSAAFAAKEFSPSVTAIMGKAKVNGLITDKIGGDRNNPLELVTRIELVAPKRIE
jgi:phage terminase small subunit